MTTDNGSAVKSHAYWCGSLACAIAWYLATGKRDHLERAYRDYRRKGASADVGAHLDAIWKGGKR